MEKENAAKFSVQSLNLFYGEFQALKSIDLDITANEITALIGPSGCGKSTFLKTLNRMNDLEPNVRIEGTVHLDQIDVYRDMDAIETAQTGRHGLSAAESVPQERIRQRGIRASHQRREREGPFERYCGKKPAASRDLG